MAINNNPQYHTKAQADACLWHRIESYVALVLFLLLSLPALAITPVQTYYVPLEESDIQPTLDVLSATGAGTNIETVVSIAVGFNDTVIHYDHAEDGYEADLANTPTQGSSLIWGDGNGANGAAPGFPGDVLNAGDVIVLQNTVALPRNDSVILFDAADKFISSKPVAVTRAAWALNPGTVLAGAVEVYPTNQWGTQFESPIGEDLAIEDDQIFELVTASYMAAEDGTELSFDIDGNGSVDQIAMLDEGQSVFIPAAVLVGATGTSNKPVQVHAITGDIGARWESRWAIVFPSNLWADEYFVPVSTRESNSTDPTDVFLYNPNDVDITVSWETTAGPQTDIEVPSGGNARATMPNGTGARFFTTNNAVFYAIVTIDSDPDDIADGGSGSNSNQNNRDYDWGFTSLPPSLLSSQALVGFAPSIDPNSCTPGMPFDCNPPNGPGSPVWVMSTEPTGATIFIDFDADPTTGTGSGYDTSIVLNGLERARIFDPNDNDMTGSLLYTEDGSFIAVAWGQDPENSVRVNPYFDAGTVIPPLPSFTIVKEVNKALVEPGAELTYTITITNTSRSPLPNVLLSDELPPYTSYVADSAELGGASFPDAGTTPFPLDEGGATLAGPLQPGLSFIFTFDVTVDLDTPIGDDEPNDCEDPQTRLLNEATATAVNFTTSDDALTCVVFTPDIEIEKATNGVDADNAAAGDAPQIMPGDDVTWTYKVTNTGQLPLNNVTVSDDIIGAISCPQSTLDVGEMMTCTAMGTAEDLLNDGSTTVPGLCGSFPETPLYENMGTASGEWIAGEFVQDVDPSHYCNPPMPGIDIEKATNGVDADDPNAGDAPVIAIGGLVSWTYVVTNTGDVSLMNVAVVDDQGVPVSCPLATLAAGASMICTASGIADNLTNTAFTTVPGLCGGFPNIPLYENMGTATGETVAGNFLQDVDPSHYCNPPQPGIDIEKATNTIDADDPNTGDAPQIAPGDPVTWTYVVTNTGDVPLLNVTVVDDPEGPISCPTSALDVGAMMTCTASGFADDLPAAGVTTVPGLCGSIPNRPLYENKGTATGQTIIGSLVHDVDPSHYCNPPEPGIDIEKATNGVDADDPNAGDAPALAPGDRVTWSYVVTNTGDVALLNVAVLDDQGVAVSCPQDTLAVSESMTCTASGLADDLLTTDFNTVLGLCGGIPDSTLYQNMGTATGQTVTGAFVEDIDPSHYCNTIPDCEIVVDKTCEIVAPPPPPFSCEGKIDAIVMTLAPVYGDIQSVTAYLGDIGQPTLPVTINGNEVSVSGYQAADAPNNVIWQYTTSSMSGQSEFHLSCSDDDMDGETDNSAFPQDCGKPQGDGKDNNAGDNIWLLEGMTSGQGGVLNCTPDETVGTTSQCEIQQQNASCVSIKALTGSNPENLTFQYTGGGCAASNSAQDSGDLFCNESGGGIDGSLAVSITDDDGNMFNVAPGGIFTTTRSASKIFTLSNTGTEENGRHVSCSQPLQTGDVHGSLTLVSLDGVGLGSEVTYFYDVQNPGANAITNISVVDDPLAPGGVPGSPITELAPGGSARLSAAAFITETTVNTATVNGSSLGASCTAMDTATVTVLPPPPCEVTIQFDKLDKDKIKWEVTNTSGSVATLDTFVLDFPTAYGTIKEVKLDGAVYKASESSLVVGPGVTIGPDDWTESNVSKRQLDPGESRTLEAKFTNKVSDADWSAIPDVGDISFEEGCSVDLVAPPN